MSIESLDRAKKADDSGLNLFFKEAYEASPALVREAALLATSIPACLLRGAEESINDPNGTFDRAVSAVGIGLALGLVTKRPRALLKLVGEAGLPLAKDLANNAYAITGIKTAGHIAGTIFGTLPFFLEAASPERLKSVSSAIKDTWNSNGYDTLFKSRDKVSEQWGRFVFDSVAMVPLAKAGDHLGVKSLDCLSRKSFAPEFALASTIGIQPIKAKAEPLFDNTLQMVAQDSAPHKRPGTEAHKTYNDFQESLESFGEIRNSVAELQKRGSNIDESKDLWNAAHQLIKTITAAKTSKQAYQNALQQMSVIHKQFTTLMDARGNTNQVVRDIQIPSARRIESSAQRILPKSIFDAKLNSEQLKAYEHFVKHSRTITTSLDSLQLPAEDKQALCQSMVKALGTINALAAESQNPAKRQVLDVYLQNMLRANEVIDSLGQSSFKAKDSQGLAIAKLLTTHISNLDQDLAINFEKAASSKAQLRALSLYCDLIEQIALKTSSAKDSGHKYETQVARQLQNALKASDDHKVFVPAQNYSPADSIRMDGILIDLAGDKVMPIDFGLGQLTIANKIVEGKGVWGWHLPKCKPSETLGHLRHFEDGSYFFEPLKLAAQLQPKEMAMAIKHKLDVKELAAIESTCQSARELQVVRDAHELLESANYWHTTTKQRAFDRLTTLVSDKHTNPSLKESIQNYINGTHYKKYLNPLAATSTEAAEFIRTNQESSKSDFQSLFSNNRSLMLLAGELLGLSVKDGSFVPPLYELSMFHSKLGHGANGTLALPSFRFDPLAAAENSLSLIKSYENFLQNNPNHTLANYLLKCAKDSELHRDSVSQIGSALAVGLAANKLGAIEGSKPGLGFGPEEFTKGKDQNGQYISYVLSSAARQAVKESALNGSAHQAKSLRIYQDGTVRLSYIAVRNGSVKDASYELGPFEYWNQLAEALLKKAQPNGAEVTWENHIDQSKNLMSLVEALELGLTYESKKLGNMLFHELQSSGWMTDGKSHTHNAPIAAKAKPATIPVSRTASIDAGRAGTFEIRYSTRIPNQQVREAFEVYQGFKKANLMSMRLPNMRPTITDAPADKAYTYFSREKGLSYSIYEYAAENGIDTVITNGTRLVARFRVMASDQVQ